MAFKVFNLIRARFFNAASDTAMEVGPSGETNPRLTIDAGGKISWGSGSSTVDTNLYRDSSNALKTDDDLKVGGKLSVTGSSGDEGGEINLAIPQTNSTINTGVVIDVYQNRLRIFEQGGSNRGAYIDLTAASESVNSNLLTGGGGGASTLDDLTDVTVPAPTSGDFLKWNGSAWVNDAIDLGTDTTGNYVSGVSAGTGISVTHTPGEGSTATIGLNASLDDLSNVTAPSPSSGDFLKWNGSAWVNDAIDLGTDTTGNYMSGVTAGTGVSITHTPGEGSNATIGIGQAVGTGDSPTFAGLTINGGGFVIAEGTTPDDYELFLQATDPTADRTITFPDSSGTIALEGQIELGTDTTGNYVADVIAGTGVSVTHTPGEGSSPTVAIGQAVGTSDSPTFAGLTINGPSVVFEGATVNDFETTLQVTDPSGDRTITLPDASGTIALAGSIALGTDTTGNYVADVTAGTGIAVTHTPGEASSASVALNAALDALSDVTAPSPSSGDFLKWNGSAWVNDAIDLGTDTTGNYMSSVTGGTGISVAHTPGEGSSATISLNAALDALTDVTVPSPSSGDFLKWNGSAWVNDAIDLGTDTTGNYMSGVTAGTGVTVTHTPGEGSSATIGIGQAVGTSDSPTFANITISNSPTQANHAATKSYVDGIAAGIDWHEAVRLGTAASLPNSPSYDNGTSGVGATLTATENARLLVDGTNANNGDRLLIKNESTDTRNGIYVVTDQGSVSAPWVIMRATDFDSSPSSEIKTGEAVFVTGGATNIRQGYVLTSSGSGTGGAHVLSTDSLTFTQFTGTAAFTAGDGMAQSGNTLNVGTASATRIVVNADNIDLATVGQTNTSGSSTTSFISGVTVDSYGRVTGKETSSIDFSSSVQKSIIDAKGDLIVGSSADTVARLEAGANGTYLKANSGATNGVEWGSITLGTDTTGNYMSGVTAGTGINVVHSPGEGSSATISIDATLDNLSNVTVPSPSNGEFLKWNGTAWVNDAIDLGTDTTGNYVVDVAAGTGISISHTPAEASTPTISLNAALDALTDVTAPSPSSGDFLKWNGSAWVNDAIDLGTDTTGNYMSGINAGTGVSVTHTPGEGSSATIAIGQAVGTSDSPTFAGLTINGSSVTFEGSTANDFETTVSITDPTADRTITVPDASGTIALAGSIALGTDTTGNYVADVTAGTGISVTHTPSEGSTATVALNAALDALSDVTAPSPSSGDFLKWNGSAWVNDAIDLGTDTTGNYMSGVTAGTGVTVTHTPGEGSNATIGIGQAVATTDSPTFANVIISSAPSQSNHAATKSYVDSIAAGIDWHEAVRLTTAASLPNSPTYNNGTSGVGATLTASSNARLVVDGSNVDAGDRILVKDQSTAAHNGIYVVTEQGSVSVAWVLTRSSDFDSSPSSEIKTGEAVFTTAGSTNIRQGYVLTSTGSGTAGAHVLNTDALTFTQFTGTSAFTAGDGMSQSGNTINVGTASTNRIVVNADNIDLATVSQTNTSGSSTTSFISGLTVDSYGRVTGKETSSVDLTSTVQQSLIDAKGDLIVGSADNSVARLAVGTNGYFLKANSSATNGVEWASIPTINNIDDIGDVVITSAANGQMLIYDGTNWVNQALPSQEPMGHENKADSTISFNNTTRVFTIQPVSTSYTVWVKGKRFVKTTSSTVTIPNTTGLYYIYFDSNGALQYQTTYFDWDDQAPTAYIYWNSTTSVAEFFADERHGIVLDWQTHEYLHRTRGAVIANGFGASNYNVSGDGSSDAHAKLDIANGTFFDEDLQVDITHSATPTANTWEQVLQGNAEIPVFYKSGTAWVKDAATEFPLKQGTSRPQYNSYSAPNWSATDIVDNKFGISWIIATNNLGEPVIALLGQDSYNTTGEAEAATWEDLNLDGFPVFEFRPLYKVVYQCADAYTNSVNARFVGVYDLRRVVSAGEAIPTTPVSDHGSLTGLSDDDHSQYLHKTETRAGITADISTTGTIAGSTLYTNQSVIFEGPTANDFETTLQVTDPTADRTITLPDGTGTVALLGSIALGTDTTGNYVANVAAGTGLSVSHTPGEGSTPTLSLNANLDALSDVTAPSPTSGDFLKWNGSAWVNDAIDLGTDTTGNYMSGVSAGTGISVTHTPAEGSTATIGLNANLDDIANVTVPSPSSGDFLKWNGTAWVNDAIDLGTDTTGNYMSGVSAGTGVSVTHTPGEGSTATIAIGQSVGTTDNPTFAGATLDAVQIGITASAEIDTTAGNLTIDSAGGTVTIDDNLVVSGDLTVNGTTTTVNTATLNVSDNIVVLNNDVSGSPTENAGIEVERGTSANVLVRWNEANDKWEITNDGTTYGNIISSADSGTVTSTMIADGTIVNADVNASAAIALSKLASGTAGQVIIANASGVPTYTTLSGDVTVDSSGVVSIAANSVALGTDTTGNYMSGVSAGTGVSVTHTPGEGSTATIGIGQSVATTANPTFAGATLDAIQVGITAANEIDTTAGNLILDSSTGTTQVDDNILATGTVTVRAASTQDSVIIQGRAGGTSSYSSTITPATLSASRTITLPDTTGTVVTTGDSGTVTSTMIADGTIVDADISSTAAISHSKLANATAGQVLLGATTTGVVTATTVSGDITITGAGVTAIGSGVIVNADVNASAAIALSKLASGTAGQVVIANASGVPTYTTLSGDVTVNSSGVVSIAANSVALGTDTTGNYVADVTAGTGVTVTHTPGEGSSAAIAIGQSVATNANPTFAGATLDAVQVGITASSQIDTVTGDLVLDSAGGTVYVNDALIVSGNLTVNGTTSTVNSTTITVDDPIITLGGDTAPSVDDNKDRGVEFRWHNGTAAKTGFFGYDDSSGRFVFIPDATNTSEVFSGSLGPIDVSDVLLSGTASTGTGGVARATSPTISLPSIDNPRLGYTTTATAAGTTTLTSSSNLQQYFTGTTTQTVVLPVASTMTLGQGFEIHNNSTGTVTVNSSGGNTVATIPGGLTASIVCILTSGTTAASWDLEFSGAGTRTGSGSLVYSASPTFTGTVILPTTTQILEDYLSVTASTTLTTASHSYKVIEVNSASNLTMTLPTNAAQAFPVGTTITFIRVGTGEVTIAGDAGVTLNNPLGARLRVQWSTATVRKRATDTWLLSGDLKV